MDAVIWAEQQLLAIPGWPPKDQNARLEDWINRDNLSQEKDPDPL
jgi:hypothetical protein